MTKIEKRQAGPVFHGLVFGSPDATAGAAANQSRVKTRANSAIAAEKLGGREPICERRCFLSTMPGSSQSDFTCRDIRSDLHGGRKLRGGGYPLDGAHVEARTANGLRLDRTLAQDTPPTRSTAGARPRRRSPADELGRAGETRPLPRNRPTDLVTAAEFRELDHEHARLRLRLRSTAGSTQIPLVFFLGSAQAQVDGRLHPNPTCFFLGSGSGSPAASEIRRDRSRWGLAPP